MSFPDEPLHHPDYARDGILGSIVGRFLEGRNAVILLLLALAAGFAAIQVTPREEEPQIVVPMADVVVMAPGHDATEVERLVATPLERLLWQVDGVEHVHSMSMRDRAVVTVQFYVGEDREDSILKLHNRLESHLDELPSAVESWLVRPVEIDDVPIVNFTLYGEGHDIHSLRRIGEEMKARLDLLPELSQTELIGGPARQVRVELDRERLDGRDITVDEVGRAIRAHSTRASVGSFDQLNTHLNVDVGEGFRSIEELRALVVAMREGNPVRLGEVATIEDGPAEVSTYTRFLHGAASGAASAEGLPSVTLAIAKQKGTDATQVAARVLAEAERLRSEVIPDGVEMVVTRNYGETADAKVDDLLSSIAFALITVVALLFFTLGWREALVVAMAVPVSFALSLFVNLLLGYTINRVTLFALILSLGLVVDDPITNVDNIRRHLTLGHSSAKAAVRAGVVEVLPPVMMSTLTIIVSFLPMFFITGMMGPYMQPMAINVPLAVSFSTVAALTVVPWLAHRLLKGQVETVAPGEEDARAKAAEQEATSGRMYAFYRATLKPLIASRARARLVLVGVLGLFIAASSLAAFGLVPLKMLPFDNKNELQVMVDLPEGSTLEATDAAIRDIERVLVAVPEVLDVQSYVGTSSPMDFNGLVRHTYMRRAPELGDIRVTLLPKDERDAQSHAIALRIRDSIQEAADRHDAAIRLVEVPPGPPVIATVVAQVHGGEGSTHASMLEAASLVAEQMRLEDGVREVDIMAPTDHERLHFVLDREQAANHGITEASVVSLLGAALQGQNVAAMRVPTERQTLPVVVRLPIAARSDADRLGMLMVRASDGSQVALQEVGHFETRPASPTITHKDLDRVVYITAEAVGRPPAEIILGLMSAMDEVSLPESVEVRWDGEGEWDITLRVFRDLGIAFGAAMVLIYLLLILETSSLAMPLLVMMAIPLTVIGIMPGFWLLNTFFAEEVGGYMDSVYFTATAMIGMIALGGIVVRNSLVLMEFIEDRLAAGVDLREAIYQSGGVRMRPILLTAGTTALGAWPITLDPIFSGLAWSLIFGLFASTFFTLAVVPAAFFLLWTGSSSKTLGG